MEEARDPAGRLLRFPRASLDFVEKRLHKILRWAQAFIAGEIADAELKQSFDIL